MDCALAQIKIDHVDFDKKSEIHLLPCKISFTGEAKVKTFFSDSILPAVKSDVNENDLFNTESNFI